MEKRRKPTNKRTVVLLEADAVPGTTMATIHSLSHAGGYRIFSLARTPDGIVSRSRRSRYISRPGFNWADGPEQLNDLVDIVGDAILLPLSMKAVSWMALHSAELRQHWRLPLLPSPETFAKVSDKATFSALAMALGCQVPPFVLLAGNDTPMEGITLPVLLKPRSRTGGAGIKRCNTEAELQNGIKGVSPDQKYMVQNYVEGDSVSCGLICEDGEILCQATYKCLARSSDFAAFKAIERIEHPEINRALAKLVKGLRWTGILNIDLILGADNRVHLLEANPRFWGNVLAMTAWGVNFADLMCHTAYNEPFPEVHNTGERFFSSGQLLAQMLFKSGKRMSISHQYSLLWRQSGIPYMLQDPLPHIQQYKIMLRDLGRTTPNMQTNRQALKPLE